MNRPLLVSLLLIPLLLSAVECGRNQPVGRARAYTGSPTLMAPRASLTGTVVFSPSDENPIYIPDFRVTLQPSRKSATTDLTGRFVFENVSPGRYTVCWEQLGWVAGCSEEVFVTAGQSSYASLIELEPETAGSVAWETCASPTGAWPCRSIAGSEMNSFLWSRHSTLPVSHLGKRGPMSTATMPLQGLPEQRPFASARRRHVSTGTWRPPVRGRISDSGTTGRSSGPSPCRRAVLRQSAPDREIPSRFGPTHPTPTATRFGFDGWWSRERSQPPRTGARRGGCRASPGATGPTCSLRMAEEALSGGSFQSG